MPTFGGTAVGLGAGLSNLAGGTARAFGPEYATEKAQAEAAQLELQRQQQINKYVATLPPDQQALYWDNQQQFQKQQDQQKAAAYFGQLAGNATTPEEKKYYADLAAGVSSGAIDPAAAGALVAKQSQTNIVGQQLAKGWEDVAQRYAAKGDQAKAMAALQIGALAASGASAAQITAYIKQSGAFTDDEKARLNKAHADFYEAETAAIKKFGPEVLKMMTPPPAPSTGVTVDSTAPTDVDTPDTD